LSAVYENTTSSKGNVEYTHIEYLEATSIEKEKLLCLENCESTKLHLLEVTFLIKNNIVISLVKKKKKIDIDNCFYYLYKYLINRYLVCIK